MGDSFDPPFAPSFYHFFDHSFGPSLLHFLLDFQPETAIVTLCLLAPRNRHVMSNVCFMQVSSKYNFNIVNRLFFALAVTLALLVIDQIFWLACDWSKRVT